MTLTDEEQPVTTRSIIEEDIDPCSPLLRRELLKTPLNPSTAFLSLIISKTATPIVAEPPPPSNTNTTPTTKEKWSLFWKSKTAVIIVVSLALFTDMILYDCILPILPELLKRANVDEGMMGVLFAAYALGFLLATPVISIWSDRKKDRKTPMILGQIGLAVSTMMFAYLGRSFTLLIVARILQGIGAAVSWTLGLALLADTIPPSELGSAMGVVFGFNTLGYLVGPPLGGIFAQYFGLEAPFIICSVLCIIDLVGRALIDPPNIIDSTTDNSSGNEEYSDVSIKKFISLKEVFWILLATGIANASIGALETLISIHLQKTYSLNVFQVSLAMMAIIVPCIIGAFVGGEQADHKNRFEMIFWGMVFYSLSLVLLGLSKSLPAFLVSCCLFGYFSSIVEAPAMPEMACILNRLGGNNYAQIYGVFNVSYSVGMLFGPLLISWMNHQLEIDFNRCMIIFSFTLLPLLWPMWSLAQKAKVGELESMKIREERLDVEN